MGPTNPTSLAFGRELGLTSGTRRSSNRRHSRAARRSPDNHYAHATGNSSKISFAERLPAETVPRLVSEDDAGTFGNIPVLNGTASLQLLHSCTANTCPVAQSYGKINAKS